MRQSQSPFGFALVSDHSKDETYLAYIEGCHNRLSALLWFLIASGYLTL